LSLWQTNVYYNLPTETQTVIMLLSVT